MRRICVLRKLITVTPAWRGLEAEKNRLTQAQQKIREGVNSEKSLFLFCTFSSNTTTITKVCVHMMGVMNGNAVMAGVYVTLAPSLKFAGVKCTITGKPTDWQMRLQYKC